jgi:hypothetical protein
MMTMNYPTSWYVKMFGEWRADWIDWMAMIDSTSTWAKLESEMRDWSLSVH